MPSSKSSEQAFFRTLLALIIPITIQNLINQAVNSADVFMLGYVGQNALSAVSLANQMQFIVTGFFWGATSGTALLAAQYWGKQDIPSVQAVMGIGIKVSVCFTAMMSFIAILMPHTVMTLFTDDSQLVSIGSEYLRMIGITFILQAFTQIYECTIRNIERATTATVISSITLMSNVVMNAVFIFGLFGFPRMGVMGVAIATLLARILELLACIVDAIRNPILTLSPAVLLKRNVSLTKDFFRFSVPALANDVSWTVAFSLYSIILGHLGSDMLAASAVATTVRDLCTVVCMSFAAAGVAIIGKDLGKEDMEQAKLDGSRILKLSLLAGVLTGILIILLIPVFTRVFPLDAQAQRYLRSMLLISSYYIVFQTVNTVLIQGVFRSGGDTKFGMICDTVNMWCVSLPISFFCAFVLKLPPMVVYFIICLDEIYKLPAELIYYKKYRWLKNITQ